jgi:hypothetical protein
MIRSSALLGLVALAATGLVGVPAQAATNVTVSISSASNGHVGQGFAGFSYEKDRVGAGMFDPADANLVKLFRLLGPSSLRIGGNLVDIVNWNPAGAGGSAAEVAPPDVTKLAAFVKATGWKVIYGINLKTNTAANAANEAQVAAKVLGSSLEAFEIGNEPNFYNTEATYETAYESYEGAIRAKVPGAVFDGPGATNGQRAWLTPFATKEKANGLGILTMHSYIGDQTTGTIAGMLASNSSGIYDADQTALGATKTAQQIPQWRMSEANSYYHGGTPGVSNVEAASLWTLDFMYGIAAHNGDGVNFHGGTSTQFPLEYSPIAYSGLTPTGVQGVYYGELLWKLAGTGSLHAATVSGASSVSSWGIGNNVVLNNKGTSPVTVNVTLKSAAYGAGQYTLTAPAIDSTSITIAGSGVNASGTFTPSPKALHVSGKHVTVTIPAGSATLVVTH